MRRRYRVRPWREGDPPTCTWANRTRTHAPPCGPPVAIVTTTYINYSGDVENTRTTTVCEYHRLAVYDGYKAARQRSKDIYRLGRAALLGTQP